MAKILCELTANVQSRETIFLNDQCLKWYQVAVLRHLVLGVNLSNMYLIPELDTVAFGSIFQQFWSECCRDELCISTRFVEHI